MLRLACQAMITLLALGMLSFGTFVLAGRVFFCPPEVVREVSLPEAEWRVATIVRSCGALATTTMKLQATNIATGVKIDFLRLLRAADITVTPDGPSRLIVNLPFSAQPDDVREEFGNVQVIYQYVR